MKETFSEKVTIEYNPVSESCPLTPEALYEKIVLPSGISTNNNTITFTNHGFNDGELITYSHTGNSLSGLSTTNQYYVLKVDNDTFRLANAGIGGTVRTEYDRRKSVELRITGVLSDYVPVTTNSTISVGDKITVKNIGEIIKNPDTDKTYKEIFANSWIYNTSSRFYIDSFATGSISQVTLKSDIDKSSLKVGDYIDILYRDSQTVVSSNLEITAISGKQVTTAQSFTLSSGSDYDIRIKIKNASSSTYISIR